MSSEPTLQHDDLHATADAVARNYGFLYVFHGLAPGRQGERCDTIAFAPRYIQHTGWPTAGGDQDEYIDFGDSLVIEEKRTRSDFLADNAKAWRDEDPKYGRFFAYLACAGVIKSADELRPWAGWFEVDPESGLWEMRKAPLRRNRLIRGHELMLLAMHANRSETRPVPTSPRLRLTAFPPPSGVAIPRPQPRKGDRDLDVADRVLRQTPRVKAATIIALAEQEHGHQIDDSPIKFADRLRRAGFPTVLAGGARLFMSRDAAEFIKSPDGQKG